MMVVVVPPRGAAAAAAAGLEGCAPGVLGQDGADEGLEGGELAVVDEGELEGAEEDVLEAGVEVLQRAARLHVGQVRQVEVAVDAEEAREDLGDGRLELTGERHVCRWVGGWWW